MRGENFAKNRLTPDLRLGTNLKDFNKFLKQTIKKDHICKA